MLSPSADLVLHDQPHTPTTLPNHVTCRQPRSPHSEGKSTRSPTEADLALKQGTRRLQPHPRPQPGKFATQAIFQTFFSWRVLGKRWPYRNCLAPHPSERSTTALDDRPRSVGANVNAEDGGLGAPPRSEPWGDIWIWWRLRELGEWPRCNDGGEEG